MANLLSTNVSGRLYVSGYVDTNVNGAAFRFYDGTTFRGGLGLDDWAHSGSAADITMYVAGAGTFYITTNSVKRHWFNGAEVAFRTYAPDLNYKTSFVGGDQLNAYYGSGSATLYVQYHNGSGGNFNVGAGKLTVDTAGTVIASGSLRAPIFYDSNDTTYYLDPNSSTSGYFAGTLRQNVGKYVRDSYYRTISGYGDYYSSGNAGWTRVAEIRLTSNCGGAVLYGTLYDHRYDGADAYQISIVARAECDFTSNNESHYINVGCTITGSTAYSNYRDKIRVLLIESSAGSRKYEVQFYETNWNHNTWQLESNGWTVLSSAEAPGASVGGERVNYISNQNADNVRANSAVYSPIFYDSADTAYYVDPNSTSNLAASYIGRVLINYDGTDTWFRMQSGNRMRITTTGGTDFIIPNTGEMTYNGNTVIHSGNIGSQSVSYATTAGSITSQANSATITAATAATINTIALRDASGDLTVRELVMNVAVQNFTPSSMVAIYPTTNQAVKVDASGARAFLNVPTKTGGDASGTWGISITGNANTATSAGSATSASTAGFSDEAKWISYPDGPRDLSDRSPSWNNRSVAWDFVGAGTANGSGNYGGVMTFVPWDGTSASTGDSSYQLAFANTTGVNASGQPKLSIRNGINSTWNAWYTLIHSGNIGSQSVTYATSAGSAGTAGSAGSVDGLTLTSSANNLNPNDVTQNQIGYNTSVSLFGQTDGGLYSSAYSSSWIHQIYGDFRSGQIAIRGKNSGTWGDWRLVVDDKNISSYAVPYGNMTSSTGLNDNKLYLRTNGDNNHYIWNAADDWEEIVAYSGTGLRIASSTGVTLATFSTSGNSMNITGNAATATYATSAGSAGAVAWGNVSSKPGNIMFYEGFTLDANTMTTNSTGFTYANNAPFYGPIARFSTGGGYDLWLGGSYNGGGNAFFLRTRDGDAGALNAWREIITSGNIGSQSVSYATTAGSLTSMNISQFTNNSGYITSFTETNTFLGDGGNADTHPGTDRIIFTGQLSLGAPVLGMPSTDNSNAIININRHPGEYNSQLGFSSNGSMYYRSFSAAAINNSQAWRQVWDSGNLTNLNQLTNGPGYITGYTETDTLSSVTGRGATTASQVSFTKTDDHAISVGTIRGRAVGSQTGEFIQLYERVNIGGPSGWGAANTAAPTYGLSVYGGATIGYGNSGGLVVTGTLSATNFSGSSSGTNTGDQTNISGNSATTSQIVFSDLKINFPSGAGGGHSFGANHYSMGLDVGNGGWDHPHYRDVIIGYHTGIRLGANYSGIRFYNNSPTTDANNDGNGDGGEALLMTIGGYVGTANHTDVVVNNNLFANVSMRAPIFYDSNDTYYYVDPNSTSRLVSTRIIGGELRFQNGQYYNNLEYWGARMFSQDDGNGVPLYVQVQWVGGWYNALKIASGLDDNNPSLRTYRTTQLATDAGNVSIGGTASSHKLHVYGTAFATSDFRAPIFYDSADTGYYLDPNGTSNLVNLTTSTRARWNMPRTWNDRSARTSDQNYWTGTNGWGTGDGTWATAWNGGFSGWDIWGTGTDHPQGAGYVHAQGIVSGQHLATTDGSSGYGWMMVGAADAVTNRYWLRGKWGTTTSGWTEIMTSNQNTYAWNMDQWVRTTDSVSFAATTSPTFLVNSHSDNTKGYRIHNTSSSSVSAMFVNSSNQLVIAAGAVDQINLNKKVYVNGVALGVNIAPSATAGRIDASNDIVAYSSSDERLKDNITPIENALDKVKSLTGVEFDWKPEYKHAHGYEGHDTGIIAQQVQEVIPSAVRTNDTGFLAVRYEKLIGLLVEGMKEQQSQIEELKAKIDGLTK